MLGHELGPGNPSTRSTSSVGIALLLHLWHQPISIESMVGDGRPPSPSAPSPAPFELRPPSQRPSDSRYTICDNGHIVLVKKGSPSACKLVAKLNSDKKQLIVYGHSKEMAIGPISQSISTSLYAVDYILLGMGPLSPDSIEVRLRDFMDADSVEPCSREFC